jgi:NAD(P)H-dependent flavin oxidoreductase YrpB (nitropropane dioxygenase family)
MQWVGLPVLAAAVSEAGGLGMLTALSSYQLPSFLFLALLLEIDELSAMG